MNNFDRSILRESGLIELEISWKSSQKAPEILIISILVLRNQIPDKATVCRSFIESSMISYCRCPISRYIQQDKVNFIIKSEPIAYLMSTNVTADLPNTRCHVH